MIALETRLIVSIIERYKKVFPLGKLMEKNFQMETMIEDYVSKGWKFRIKQVKGHRYITAYKKGKEKSLGPYNNDLWKLIEDKGGKVSKSRRDEAMMTEIRDLKERVKELERVDEVARNKSKNCHQIDSWFGFTYCKALSWDKKPSKLMKLFPQLEFKRMMPDRIKMWYVKPHPDLCRGCMIPMK